MIVPSLVRAGRPRSRVAVLTDTIACTAKPVREMIAVEPMPIEDKISGNRQVFG